MKIAKFRFTSEQIYGKFCHYHFYWLLITFFFYFFSLIFRWYASLVFTSILSCFQCFCIDTKSYLLLHPRIHSSWWKWYSVLCIDFFRRGNNYGTCCCWLVMLCFDQISLWAFCFLNKQREPKKNIARPMLYLKINYDFLIKFPFHRPNFKFSC